MKLTPTTLENRIETLDILRGFSLLGILIANMLLFHTPYFYIEPYHYFTENGDFEAFKWVTIFVQGSFYPIFAFLFGYGLNMQYEKAIERKQPFAKMMSKRLSILLVFGLVHALFIWSGDVLFSYATLGFLLIIFVRIPAKWLAISSIVLYTIPGILLYLLMKLVSGLGGETFADEMTNSPQIEKALAVFGNGSFGEIFAFRGVEWLIYGLSSTLLGLFIVLPIIMFGAAMSKWKVIERVHELKGKFMLVAIIATAIGLWIKFLPFVKSPTYDYIQLQTTFGGVFLASGYVAIFLLFMTSTKIRAVFSPFGKVGRMSLTIYVMQSVIATIIFYGFGFGLYGKVSIWTGTLMAFGIFVLQVIFAQIWLSKFKMGPLEKLWRMGTYGRKSAK